MEFTGTNLVLKRSIYPQTGNYSFQMDASVDNTTGKYFFGLSGNGNVVEFRLESGKLFFGDKFLHSYLSNQEFSVMAEFTNSKMNLHKDDVPLVFGYDKPTGYFDYFYFKRQSNDLAAEFDIEITGDSVPSYDIQQNGYLIYSGQNAVTGRFTNNSIFPIRVFDSYIDSSQPYSFGRLGNYINAFASGIFAYSGDFDSIDISQPILTTFDTNFGSPFIFFNITDLRALNGFILLRDIDDFSLNAENNLNRDVTYLNYSGGIATTGFNANLSFVLDYVSGSGVFDAGAYFKTFSGSWAMFTGINESQLYSMPVSMSNVGRRMEGSGIFPPNSFVNFQLNHINSGTNADGATLTISGQLVTNPISTTLSIQNV